MSYVIAVSNEKGDTGKSTTALNVGSALAEQGHRTLLVDLDPSYGLTRMLGVTSDAFEVTIRDVLAKDSAVDLPTATQNVKELDNLFFVPGHEDLAFLENTIQADNPWWAEHLRKVLAQVADAYTVIILDCPPGLGFYPTNAYASANMLLIPVQTELIAVSTLSSIGKALEDFPSHLRPNVHLVLPTMFDARTKHAQEILAELKELHPDNLSNFIIPRTTGIPDSTGPGIPFIHYKPDHQASKAFRGVAQEIIDEWQIQKEKA